MVKTETKMAKEMIAEFSVQWKKYTLLSFIAATAFGYIVTLF